MTFYTFRSLWSNQIQTFLPYSDFARSALCLDNKRLGKQRVEVLQILNAISTGGGWSSHPATRMWRGFEWYLAHYGLVICAEWVERGYIDNCARKIECYLDIFKDTVGKIPTWMSDFDFHASHRSNLLRKDYEWYSQFGWLEVPGLPYVWPVR